ncbi:POTRA domain-containing protein [Algoriphagus litoralis]|uniref:POTRA domain-containing protein n=1 Tax=Algoriphagus litoralis TaxID=2202829 RepID=UPI00130068C5|nr:BamA/TamA family outer membrane protein [Algoriphagus litoralis]
MDSLSAIFHSQGYLEGFFQERELVDTTVFLWEFGRLFAWEEVNSDSLPEELIKALGKPGLGYSEPYLWMNKALTYAENRGFPFASLNLDSLSFNDSLISGVIVFDSGPRITWDSIGIVGNSKTKVQYLQQLSGLVPGEFFSQLDLEKAAQSLRRSPYFTLAGSPELLFQTRQAKPVFALQDRRVNVFDGVIGLLPNENEPGRVLVTGEVDLRLFHLGGKGRDFSLNWQRLNIQSQSLDIRAKESFVFRSPLDISIGFSLLKQDSSFVNRTVELDFGYRVSDPGYLNFFTKRQAGDLISTDGLSPSGELPASIDYRWNQYGLGIDWDRLDSPINPRRGVRLQGTFSLGNKRILQNTGLPEALYADLEESTPQYQGWFSGEKHFLIRPGWGMWIRGVGGFIENQNLFFNELYRFGGLKSIRGFNEKNFFAKSFGYMNFEQRLYFDQNSYLLLFGDAGILENPYSNREIDYPFSFGTGINLDTDGGLFSFVFALGKSSTQPLSFSYSRIHFGYLARF